MTPTIEERVRAGAAWLDRTAPGWERRVDLGALDLRLGCRCVLGQLFHKDIGAVYESGFHFATETLLTHDEAIGYGFSAHDDADGDTLACSPVWRLLDEAWIALLKDRFSSGALSDEVAP